MTWSVRSIPTDEVTAHWPLVAPLLVDAVKLTDGRYTMRAVHDALLKKLALLWVIYDERNVVHAAFTTSRRQYPASAWLSVDFLGGGEMASWISECDRVLSAFARDSGLAGLELVGRKGWSRALAASGWRENAVMLVKHIDEKVD